jgi:anti-sigma regulatory factor (Ser/Thr protein kinase)
VTFAPLTNTLWSFIAEDSALHFSPLDAADKRTLTLPDLETLKPGGLGIPILKKFTHAVSYQALPVGNRITLTFAARAD